MADWVLFWIAAVGGLAGLLCGFAVLVLWRRLAQSEENAVQKQQYLEQQIGIATSGAIGMGHRIVALERKLQSLQDRQDNITGADTFAYSQALQMFEQGADVATVASNCGFSSSEAELMALVQKQTKNAGATQPGARQPGARQPTSRRKSTTPSHE